MRTNTALKPKPVLVSDKVAVKPYVSRDAWDRAVRIWRELGMNQSVGIDRLLTLFGNESIDQLRQSTGVGNYEIFSRVVTWFTSLPHKQQMAILSGEKSK